MPTATANKPQVGRLDDLTFMQKALTTPFADAFIDTITGGLTLPQAEALKERVVSGLMSAPKLFFGSVDTASGILTLADTKKPEEQTREAAGELAEASLVTLSRLPTMLQKAAIPEKGEDRIKEMFRGFLLPEEVPAGYLGGKIAEKINPDLWIAAGLAGAMGDLITYEIAFGGLGRRLKIGYQQARLREAGKEAQAFVDYTTDKIVKKMEASGRFPYSWNEADRVGRTRAFVIQQLEMNEEFGKFLLQRQTPAKMMFRGLLGEKGQLSFIPEKGPLKSNLAAVAFAKLPARAGAMQIIKTLLNSGLTQEELEFSGITNWLQKKDSYTKEEVMNYLDANKVKVEKVVKSGESYRTNVVQDNEIEVIRNSDDHLMGTFENEDIASDFIDELSEVRYEPKYSQYILPGGENYKEHLVTLPVRISDNQKQRNALRAEEAEIHRAMQQAETPEQHKRLKEIQQEISALRLEDSTEPPFQEKNYSSSHWEEPNVVVHYRTTDRVDADGKKVLFVEEIQSDWHSEGKKKGYNIIRKVTKDDISISFDKTTGQWLVEVEGLGIPYHFPSKETAEKNIDGILNDINTGKIKFGGVPNAPFKQTWHELALKHIIADAVEGGYDKVAWINGQQTADRYDLAKQVDEVETARMTNGDFMLYARKNGNNLITKQVSKLSDLEGVIGKNATQKLLEQEKENPKADTYIIKGEDLKVGGEWAKTFYDKILKQSAQKYIKKWGGKVEDVSMGGKKYALITKEEDGYLVEWEDAYNSQMFDTKEEAQRYADKINGGNINREEMIQQGFSLTPTMIKEVSEVGQPMFGSRLAGSLVDLLKSNRGMAGVEESVPLPDDWEPPDIKMVPKKSVPRETSSAKKRKLLEKLTQKKVSIDTLKENIAFLKSEMRTYKNKIGRYKGGKMDEEYNALPIYFRKKGGAPLDSVAKEAGFEGDIEFRDYLISLYENTKKAELKLENEKAEHRILKRDLKADPPTFKDLTGEKFLKQPKKKTTILQYFTPAEYHLKQLGFDAKIGQPIRDALMDQNIELAKKMEIIQSAQYDQQKIIPKKDLEASNFRIWTMMDKGIPSSLEEWNQINPHPIEIAIVQKYRAQTKEMLKRMNQVRKMSGQTPIRGIKNYILHMLRPEVLNEIYARGVIPPELAKIMENIPVKNVFLRTAMERQGVPEEWLVKDPHELMKAMFAIDLRYIHLQKALLKIDPYLKAVKDYVGPEGDYWSPETYKYLDDWVKQAVKMRPSNTDILIDNLLEYTIAPLLRKAGLKVSHMPWRDFISFYSSAIHTGALGMRAKPILRNLLQSTFDWVMYGTKSYIKASAEMHSLIINGKGEAFDILQKSKVWRTRMPFEAQEKGGLNKIFKAGSVGYRLSDLHNVGKGLLTRYYHAKENLGLSDEKAIEWMDNDLPGTQWSYRREDLPRAYWTTTGRAVWTLGSWWQNFYFRFLPEIASKTFAGVDATGRKVPPVERMAGLRFLILLGTLFAIKEESEEVLGVALDYTGQVGPTPFRESPIFKGILGMKEIAQGITDKDEKLLKSGLKKVSDSAKLTIPFYLGIQDLWDLITGEKTLSDVMFYKDKSKKKKILSK